MKPRLDRFAVVTATVNPARCHDYLLTWRAHASCNWPLYVVWNGCTDGTFDSRLQATLITQPEIGGTVPMFAKGVNRAIRAGAQVIVCLHDDVEIHESGWDTRVLSFFDRRPACVLAGFGGGTGLGADGLYDRDYDPMSLARQGFISNMRDAEAHGRRVTEPTRVACLDGFSQIGRAEFFETAWPFLRDGLDMVHHFYDGALGCLAKREGGEAWVIPVACHHAGGQTAVGERRYGEWAANEIDGGDQAFWERSHRAGYREFADVLPLRV